MARTGPVEGFLWIASEVVSRRTCPSFIMTLTHPRIESEEALLRSRKVRGDSPTQAGSRY